MYQLAISREFIARHFLIGGDFGHENFEHSHHYRAEILISGDSLDQHGYLIDILALETALLEILGKYRDKVLNDLPAFRGLNPSLEHFSRLVWEDLRDRLELTGREMTVRMWESATDWAAFTAKI